MGFRKTCLTTVALWFTFTAQAAELGVAALFSNAALITIDGQQLFLRVGDAPKQGVRLLDANAKRAVITHQGKRHTLQLNKHITSDYSQRDQLQVDVVRNANQQYLTFGEINGYRVQMLVDTGANVVAMNRRHANQLNIRYQKVGQLSQVRTAGGIVPAYQVTLDKINVGGIQVHNVAATVVDGQFPDNILLGMSYLQHVKIREESGVMTLQQRY